MIALELSLGTLSLDHDDADGVRHHVVELSRDARAFFGDGKPRLLLSLALEPACALALRHCLETPAAQSPADEPGSREHEQCAQVDTAVAGEGAYELAGDQGGVGDGGADKRSPSLAVRRNRVDRDHRCQERLERGEVGEGRSLQRRRPDDDTEHRERCAPPPRERHRDEEHEDGVDGMRTRDSLLRQRVNPHLVLRRAGEQQREEPVAPAPETLAI